LKQGRFAEFQPMAAQRDHNRLYCTISTLVKVREAVICTIFVDKSSTFRCPGAIPPCAYTGDLIVQTSDAGISVTICAHHLVRRHGRLARTRLPVFEAAAYPLQPVKFTPAWARRKSLMRPFLLLFGV
jgi:hypothetical protein